MNEMISVIIPVYNVEKYLERCIQSVINQTYNNLEIIIVDDGSTDGSSLLCDKYSEYDSRIVVIHKENGGLSDARNEGLKIAMGKYIAFLDSDDWIDLDYYEVLYNKMINTDSQIVIVGFLYVKDNKFIKPTFYLEDKLFTSKEAIRELGKDELLTSHAWNKLFKKEVLADIQFPKGKTYEDIFIMHKIFQNAEKIAVISDFKNYYFLNKESISNTPSLKNRLDEFLAFKTRYEDLKDEYPEIKDKMAKLVCDKIANIYSKTQITKEEKKKYKSEINETRIFINNKKVVSSLGIKVKIMSISLNLFSIANKIKEIIPCNIKKIIKSIKIQNNRINKLDTGDNRIILIGSPEYGNIGDLAIAYFTKKFMEFNSDKTFIEITEREFYKNFKYIFKNITTKDVLLLQGGGNMGSEYIDQEEIRSKVIKNFPNNNIILMPQTIYFSKDTYGEKIKLQMKVRYSKHKALTLFARESISFELMKEIFENDICLVPDIVMSSNISFSNIERNGVMLCLRSDIEGILSVYDLMQIKKYVSNKFNNYYITDTVYDTDVSLKDRERVLNDLWLKMQKSELVITDRLHGMIFAAITGTPCIVLGNYNHKVKNCYKWFKDLKYIEFCSNIEEISNLIEKIDYSKKYKYPKKAFIEKFEKLQLLIGKK
ncbi:glycosyltransferase [Clostridium botulinum]|nr:glycosyltransferase [Clostridium botulinum]NFP01074.1 glycosyltransferase [Clostridium botulinum]